MKKTILALSLLLATSALAARFDVPEKRTLRAIDSPRKAEVLRDALHAFPLEDGSHWITHFVPAQREPGAIGVTRFGADGSARFFLLSDWLPKGSIPRGRVGQVFGIAMLTDGRIAASGGWNDGRNSHNAVFVLRPRPDGAFDTERVIELPGTAKLAGGPNNSILVITNDPARRGGGPLVTVIDSEGSLVGALNVNGIDESLSAVEASQKASGVYFRRVGQNRFLLHDPVREDITIFECDVTAGEAVFGTGGWYLFLGDDAGLAGTRLVHAEVTPEGDVLLVRSGFVRGRAGTELTVYGRDKSLKQSTTLDVPWAVALRENGRLQGIVRRGGVQFDTIGIQHDLAPRRNEATP